MSGYYALNAGLPPMPRIDPNFIRRALRSWHGPILGDLLSVITGIGGKPALEDAGKGIEWYVDSFLDNLSFDNWDVIQDVVVVLHAMAMALIKRSIEEALKAPSERVQATMSREFLVEGILVRISLSLVSEYKLDDSFEFTLDGSEFTQDDLNLILIQLRPKLEGGVDFGLGIPEIGGNFGASATIGLRVSSGIYTTGEKSFGLLGITLAANAGGTFSG